MFRWIAPVLGAVLGFGAFAANAQTCTTTISPPTSITTTVDGMTSGQVLCLNTGTYGPGGPFPGDGRIAVGVGVIIRGLGATPNDVVLQGTHPTDHSVILQNHVGGKNVNGAQFINLRIQGGGMQILNFLAPATRLTDIKLKDVVIASTNSGSFGVLAQNTDRLVLDNVTITSVQSAISFYDVTDSLVMNSTIPATTQAAAAALGIFGGSNNRYINNTFGQPRVSAGAGYSFNGGAIAFYNTSDNRFEGNTVQGMSADAVNFTVDAISNPFSTVPTQPSFNNYVGKNLITHSAFPINGLTAGSTGIWSNCQSNGTWMYGNTIQGAAEGGMAVFDGRNNMLLGNLTFNNGQIGTFISGDGDTFAYCTVSGGAFRQKPLNNYLQSTAHYFNRNDQIVIRDADSTWITRSFASPNNGLGGAAQGCTNPACQAGFSIETDGTAGRDTTSGTRLIANTTLNNARGLWAQSHSTPSASSVTNMQFYLNRIIGSPNSRWVTSTPQNIDGGVTTGGNYWTNFGTVGNPSASAYSGVFHTDTNSTGNVVDRFTYQSENLGRGYGVTFYEPRANASVAAGTRRTVRWDSPGCVFVDLWVAGVQVASNAPNTGYAIVTVPSVAPGTTGFTAYCKDAAGVVKGTSNGPAFNLRAATLSLVTPNRDDTFNTGTTVWVGWKNTGSHTSVSIDQSADGGATWTNITTVAGISASNPVTSARVALPGVGSANAMLRVRSGGTTANCGTVCDEMDGVYALRGAAGSFDATIHNAGVIYVIGQPQRIEWASPTNSKLVTITASAGAVVTVAADLPDRGFFDWIVPELSPGPVALNATFKNMNGTTISTVNLANSGTLLRPTTITYGTIPTIVPGQAQPITVTVPAGASGVTLTSSTPSVCTVSGTTITGVANGVCTITANAGATGSFAAASPSTISFNVGASQTITFTTPLYLGVSTTYNLGATASSGLAVTYTSLTPSICTITGGNVLTGATVGTCTVAADQAGNGTFAAAPQVTRNLTSVAPINIPRLVNISTRGRVATGADVMIAGFIIGGQTSKKVVVMVSGPSLTAAGVPGALQDPNITIVRASDGAIIGFNDNWQTAPTAAEMQSLGFVPQHPNEPAVMMTLPPGAYTAVVQGNGGTTGVGLVALYEVDHPEVPLINISTRGPVGTGGDVMIAGFVIQGSNTQSVVVTVAGPSMNGQVAGAMQNPKITIVRASDGVTIATNDNWQTQTNPADVATIQNAGFAPAHVNEPAVYLTLPPGAYTAVVEGVGGTTGVALVAVYAVLQ